MSPLRLVILGVLFYILYRLFVGMKRKKTNVREVDDQESVPVADLLVEDPVCHTLVPKGQAVRLQHNNVLYYFCSETCCNRFLSEKGEHK